jgi:hypothetical protein
LKSAGKFPPVFWGLKMIPKIDDLMKQEIFKLTEAALGLGKDGVPLISYSQAFYVFDKLSTGNTSDIRMYIAFLEQKRQEEAIQRETQRKQEETQMAMAVNDKKTQDTIAVNNNKSDNTLKQQYLKHKMQIEADTHRHILTKEEKKMEHEHAKDEVAHEIAITPKTTAVKQ